LEPVEWLFAYSTQEASRAQVIHFRFSPESSSKEQEVLEASCVWEDWTYNLTRPVKSLH